MSHGETRTNWLKEGLIASGAGMLYGKIENNLKLKNYIHSKVN